MIKVDSVLYQLPWTRHPLPHPHGWTMRCQNSKSMEIWFCFCPKFYNIWWPRIESHINKVLHQIRIVVDGKLWLKWVPVVGHYEQFVRDVIILLYSHPIFGHLGPLEYFCHRICFPCLTNVCGIPSMIKAGNNYLFPVRPRKEVKCPCY